ncbi:polyprenyl synthetase family protein [ANME-2 cluster archaeon]|nr:MAG: polyprenyl synthetase family protein [ANME-2 cluster archaeon]
MDENMNGLFEDELVKRGNLVYSYIRSDRYHERFFPDDIHDSVYLYLNGRQGKSLRPAVLLFSCGAVGGDEEIALPAAAAIEIFHTWTLVHDDVIDRDCKRRGGYTVHEEFRRRAIDLGYAEDDAVHYGTSIAILAGDVQQGWSVSLLSELAERGVDSGVVLHLIREMETGVVLTLLSGQTLDVQYSRYPIESLDEHKILGMLWKKTGALYEFAGKSGAMIGLDTKDEENELVHSVSQFTGRCGIAFQLQDDILGAVGDVQKLGKPVGSDIREGKRTLIVYHAFKNADEAQKRYLSGMLGKEGASDEEVFEVVDLLRELGSIEYASALARRYVKEAEEHIADIPESMYKDLLLMWAEYMVRREL